MNKKYQEANLSLSFAAEVVNEIRQTVDSSTCFQMVSMPGTGVSNIARFLSSQNFAHVVTVDVRALTTVTKKDFFTGLSKELGGTGNSKSLEHIIAECENKLSQLTKEENKVLILINHFDYLKYELSVDFFHILRLLRNIDRQKIVYGFTAYHPSYEFIDDKLNIANITLFSKTIFLKPFRPDEMAMLLSVIAPNNGLTETELQKIITLSGGNVTLARILLHVSNLDNALNDRLVNLQLREFYESLGYARRKTLQKIAQNKNIGEIDGYLPDTGYVKKEENRYVLFSPLMKEYVLTNLPLKLSPKESAVLKLLKKKSGKVVLKDEIFETVWADDIEHATDWALNSIIYRLRKNPAVTASGYQIESHKKIGYRVTKL